ncbi:hypothetical protein C8R44DRAFT_745642 [Mycena epipterygia]|nr:hypothetical protein C8R44DRAFT_745642 [Mycena epipterygia]
MPTKVMILAQFEHGYYIRGNLKRLTDVVAWLKAFWIWIRNPWHCCLAGEEMPTKVMILAQFDHRYYIRETLKRLTNVVASLTQGAKPDAPGIQEADKESVDPDEQRLSILVEPSNLREVPWEYHTLRSWSDHRSSKGLFVRFLSPAAHMPQTHLESRNPCPHCLVGEEMPTKVMILAQFEHGYYIRGNLKRLTDVVAWLKAFWIWIRNPWHCCLAGEEMPTKVMILAQFEHGYYIRGTLKRLTDVLAWLKAWWICVGVKQVTDLKSMPLLPRWSGNACKSCDFGSVWPWILYPWDLEEADRCCGLAPGLVDLLTNSKAVFCAFSLKMSEEKS